MNNINTNNINTNNFKIKILFAELSELSESNGQEKINLFRKIIELSESNESNRQQKIELFCNIIDALIENKYVMSILNSSHFFVNEYLQQEFKQSSRFKIDKIHPSGVPLKESHEKRLRLKEKTSVKFSSSNKPNEELELQLSSFENQKPKLRYFTMGSRQHPKQFETWSPEEMYNWWLELRTSGIPKLEWKILDAVFFLFINQISCICNSYIRYGIKNNSNTKNDFKKELKLLSEYFRLLDEFYKNGGEYGKLLDTHIAFCNWFQFRIRYDKQFKSYVEYQNQNDSIFKLFNKKNENKIIYTWARETYSNKNTQIDKLRTYINNENNFYLILFTSYFQSPSKFISLYSIPVITTIGVPHKSHNAEFYSPFSQIEHDFFTHSKTLLKYLIFLYNQKNPNDINIFRKKMIFLQLLSNKKDSDAQLLFWYIIHELEFEIEYFVIDRLIPEKEKENVNWPSLSPNEKFKERQKIISIIKEYKKIIKSSILSKNTNNVNKKLQYLKINDEHIFNFFDIEILLEQLKLMKIFLIELTPEEKREALPKIIHSIDVLIETCEETIEIIKNERNKNYNNYIRRRNPHNI